MSSHVPCRPPVGCSACCGNVLRMTGPRRHLPDLQVAPDVCPLTGSQQTQASSCERQCLADHGVLLSANRRLPLHLRLLLPTGAAVNLLFAGRRSRHDAKPPAGSFLTRCWCQTPTAMRLATAAPSSAAPVKPRLGSSDLACSAVDSGLIVQTVDHTQPQKHQRQNVPANQRRGHAGTGKRRGRSSAEPCAQRPEQFRAGRGSPEDFLMARRVRRHGPKSARPRAGTGDRYFSDSRRLTDTQDRWKTSGLSPPFRFENAHAGSWPGVGLIAQVITKSPKAEWSSIRI
jgi:hypothetical protein